MIVWLQVQKYDVLQPLAPVNASPTSHVLLHASEVPTCYAISLHRTSKRGGNLNLTLCSTS